MSVQSSSSAQALAAAVLTVALTLPTASATEATGRASAAILQVISVTETRPMSFATVAPPPSGGTIVLTPAGTLRASAGFAFHGTPVSAAFHAHGLPNYPATVSISAGNLVTGPGPAMPLAVFTSNTPTSFDSAADLKFAVGAALTINPHQTPGDYNGTFAVTVNY